MIEVEFNKFDMMQAGLVGLLRHSESISRKHKSRGGSFDNGWQIHIEGALGERAAAKAIDRYWSGGVNTFKAADIGDVIQVRTRSKHEYDLIVKPDDNDDHIVILVTGQAPKYLVRGWIAVKDGKKDEWLKNPNGYGNAYFVPQTSLHPMTTFPLR